MVVTGLPAIGLSGFTVANLTDTSSSGGNTFTVSGLEHRAVHLPCGWRYGDGKQGIRVHAEQYVAFFRPTACRSA